MCGMTWRGVFVIMFRGFPTVLFCFLIIWDTKLSISLPGFIQHKNLNIWFFLMFDYQPVTHIYSNQLKNKDDFLSRHSQSRKARDPEVRLSLGWVQGQQPLPHLYSAGLSCSIPRLLLASPGTCSFIPPPAVGCCDASAFCIPVHSARPLWDLGI